MTAPETPVLARLGSAPCSPLTEAAQPGEEAGCLSLPVLVLSLWKTTWRGAEVGLLQQPPRCLSNVRGVAETQTMVAEGMVVSPAPQRVSRSGSPHCACPSWPRREAEAEGEWVGESRFQAEHATSRTRQRLE
eukprot:CAMPEP_0119420230 /NCGR_PEP_ID=MMETSP1335-20130426/22996_1 /TAXON_ID=259385 /ORGANISM="Chrysoculter rhomboideus, Strain RCC1486" /LENGTH=132 /DNA_ID=CAMNT_0007445575 /DNA_START=415 /DNA_END=810 /DNA_ORIENTATION=-